jgi:D-glycero-D-manno-heptose 1,7-bisphosphate phosphatase
MSRPAVFLDRDGVLVEEVFYPETGEIEAPLRPEDVRLLPAAAAAARMLAQAGYALVLLSNQAGYAKGKASLRALWLVHQRFVALLAREGVTLDAVFYSYSHPDGIVPYFSGPSLERKPGPYNLIIAAAQLDLDLARSWLIGDRKTDLACAAAAGVRPILVENAHNPVRRPADVIGATDLAAAAAIVVERDRGDGGDVALSSSNARNTPV